MQTKRHRFVDTGKQLKLNEQSTKDTIIMGETENKKKKLNREYMIGWKPRTVHSVTGTWSGNSIAIKSTLIEYR